MSILTRARTGSLCLLLGSGSASAAVPTEADFFAEIPLVFTASRMPQSPLDAPNAVTVIDRDMIRASGFRDIPDLLRLVPGFSVAYTRDNTWAAGYHGLADAFSRRFQVLVDGRSIYSPHFGAVYWSDLPLAIDDIERIEVVRGPNAASYGANAFVAIINIITKTAAQVPGEFVSAQAGGHGMRGLTVRHGGGDGAMSYRLTASAQQRDRFEGQAVNGDDDAGFYFEGGSTYFVNGRMDWQLSGNSNLSAQFGLSQADWGAGSFVPADPASALEPVQQDSRALYAQFSWHKVESEAREWCVQGYYSQNRFDANANPTLNVPPPLPFLVNQYLSQSRAALELQVNEQWRDNLRGVWGGEVREESVRGPQYYASDDALRGEMARAFANLEWQPYERLLLQGGAMLENHYFTGTDLSPRAAINFTLAPGHVIRLGIARAYRSPSFFEQEGNAALYLQSGATAATTTVPSAGLDPERILSREVGYVGHWRSLGLEFDARLFQDKINDFIGDRKVVDFPPGTPDIFQYQNIGSVRREGGEVELRWRPSHTIDLSAYFTRSFLDAATLVNNFNDDIPLSAPRDSWGLLAAWRFGAGWEASAGAWHSDAVQWLSDGDEVDEYTRVDARIARRFKFSGVEAEAALVGQALDGDYTEFRVENIFQSRVFASLSFAW